jgi:hypothetical protein
MPSFERWIESHRQRLEFGRFLHRAADLLAVFLFVFGATLLAAKLLAPAVWVHVLWGLAGVVPLAVLAWWTVRRAPLSRTETVALLDGQMRTGGLLMSLAEAPDPRWAERLPQAEQDWREGLPRIRPVRFARVVALPLLFAAGTALIPAREAKTEPVKLNHAARQATQQLQEMLTALDELQVLEEEEQKQVDEAVQKLVEESQHAPLTHEKWETVDALRQRLRLRLEDASAGIEKAREAAGRLAAALGGDAPPLSPEQTAQLEEDLLETLRKLEEKSPQAGAGKTGTPNAKQREQLQRLLQRGKLPTDPAERQKLLDDLKEHLDQEFDKLDEARKKCNQGKCPKCGSGQCQGADGEHECDQCQGQGSRPGNGGVTRGRGDAELTYGEENDPAGTKFKETVLPPGALEQAKDEVLGVRLTAPQENVADSAPRAGSRAQDPTAGRETWNRPLAPRHRQVVRGYFGK